MGNVFKIQYLPKQTPLWCITPVKRCIYRFTCLLLVISWLWLAGCAPPPERPPVSSAGAPVLHVVGTFFPVADIVRWVGGAHVAVQTLLPPGGDLHTFSPTARQMKLLQGADAVFRLGLDAEPFLETLLRGLGQKRPRVIELAEGCWTLPAEAEHAHEHHDAHEHHHGEAVDPHVWLSVRNAIRMVRNAQKALTELDPLHADDYQRNADMLVAELEELYADLRTRAKTWRQRKFLAAHGAYRYLAEEAGLEQVAVFEPLPGVEPSARWLRDLIRTARREKVRVIFAAPPASPRLVEVVAADMRMPVYLLDTLERPLNDGEQSYVLRMKRNVETLDTAMR